MGSHVLTLEQQGLSARAKDLENHAAPFLSTLVGLAGPDCGAASPASSGGAATDAVFKRQQQRCNQHAAAVVPLGRERVAAIHD